MYIYTITLNPQSKATKNLVDFRFLQFCNVTLLLVIVFKADWLQSKTFVFKLNFELRCKP